MRQNIYEIPKVHPFIKTLEKVKALRDNLDEGVTLFENPKTPLQQGAKTTIFGVKIITLHKRHKKS